MALFSTGVNQKYESATGNAILSASSIWTIGGWIRSADLLQASKYVWCSYDGSKQVAILYGFTGGVGQYEFYMGAADFTGTNPRTNSQITVRDSDWHHIMYRKTASTGEYAYFLDGAKTVINASATTTSATQASSVVSFFEVVGVGFFNGAMADFVATSGWSLSDDQIMRLAKGARFSDLINPRTTGVQLYHQLDGFHHRDLGPNQIAFTTTNNIRPVDDPYQMRIRRIRRGAGDVVAAPGGSFQPFFANQLGGFIGVGVS